MKKITAILLTMIMLLPLVPTIAIATTPGLELTVDTDLCATVEPGDTVTIPVKATANDGVRSFMLVAEYDATYFEPISGTTLYTAGEAITSGFTPSNESAFYENAQGENLTATGVLFYINLKVKDNAPSVASTTITVKVYDDDPDNYCFDKDYNPITPSVTPGTVTIAAPEATGATFTNGTESFNYETLNADDYTLTAPGEDYYFAGWFTGLEAAGIEKNANGYYVLSGSQTAHETTFTGVIECSPKYDAEPESGAYHALWVKDDFVDVLGAMLISVTSSGLTFYKTTGDNTTLATNTNALLNNTLIEVSTNGYVKLLHDVTVTKIMADNGDTYFPIHLDLNGKTVTMTENVFLKGTDNVIRSSYRQGQIITEYSTYAVELSTGGVTASLYDVKLSASTGIILKAKACLENLVRCEIKTTTEAITLQGGSNKPAVIERIDECVIYSSGSEAIDVAKDYAVAINMIQNSTISSDRESGRVIYPGSENSLTITFGAGNTVTGKDKLTSGGTLIFTVANGTYSVSADSTSPVLGEDCVVTSPIGYAVREENHALIFKTGYLATYMSHDGSEVLYVEELADGEYPTGSFTVEYPVEGLNTHKHLGWAAQAGGTVITDFSGYSSAVTFYAVREAVTLDAGVEVSDGTNTYEYRTLNDAFSAFKSGTITDAAGTTITFKLLSDQTATSALSMKNSNIVLDMNGNTLTVTASSLIKDQKTTAGRTITLTSSATNGKIISENATLIMVATASNPAAIVVENLEIQAYTIINIMDLGVEFLISAGSVDCSLKNVVATTTGPAISMIVKIAETVNATIRLENTTIDSAYEAAASGAAAHAVLTLDNLSKVRSQNSAAQPISGPSVAPEYGDLDGEGPETWYGLIPNAPTGNDFTTDGDGVAPVITTPNTEVTFKDENLDKRQSLTINTSAVSMNFLKDALASIAGLIESSADLTFTGVTGTKQGNELHRITLNLTANGVKVDFEGDVEVSFAFAGEEGKNYRVYYVDENGRYLPVKNSSYDPATGKMTFTASHFSEYVVMDEADGYKAGLNTTTPEVAVNGNVTVNVGVSHGNNAETAFNAAEIVVTYPTAMLELVTDALDQLKATGMLDYKVATDAQTGLSTLTIEQFGAEKNFSTGNYVLTFKALAEGTATVTLQSAAFAHKDDVSISDLQTAVLDPASVEVVLITQYSVTLPTDSEMDPENSTVATRGEAYTFKMTMADGYDYVLKATVSGVEVELIDNQDGTYTIAADKVTGPIVITFTKTAQDYTVTWEGDLDDMTEKPGTATFGQDFTFVVPADQAADGLTPGYYYSVSAVLTGTDTGVNVIKNGTTCTILAANVTGAITITVTKMPVESPQTTITVDGSDEIYLGETQLTSTAVNKNSSVVLTLKPAAGYAYVVKVNGTVATLDADKNFTVAVGTDPVTVTVEKTLKGTATVLNYLTLDGKTMFLITYTDADLAAGNVPFYGAEKMLWSDKYQAYCWLVIAETLTADTVKAAIEIKSGDKVNVAYTMDVNGTNKVDAADAQFVYNMYTAEYKDFTTVGVAQFLAADQNAQIQEGTLVNYGIDVTDATVVINAILNGQA